MLSSLSFKQGQNIKFRGELGQIRLFERDLAVISLEKTGFRNFKPEQLHQSYVDKELQLISEQKPPSRYLDGISPQQRNEIKRRQAYLYEMDKHNFPNAKGIRELTISKVASEINDEKPPSCSALSRWHRAWLSNGKDAAALVLKTDRTRHPRIHSDAIALLNEVIQDVYLTRNEPTVTYTYKVFLQKFHVRAYHFDCPSESTMRRQINKLDKLAVVEAREGRTNAREQARVAGKKIDVDFPLERVEVDAAHFNIGLLNNEGYYVGKPSLYIVIDVYSRAILGFAIHIGKAKESSAGVIHALTHAVNIKNDPDYPMYGLMQLIVRDSGPGYRSDSIKTFLSKISNSVEVAKTRKGWGKPFVERFIKRIRDQFFRTLEGYLGKYDPKKYSEESLQKSATHTVEDFHDWLYDFIVNDYHKTPHKGLRSKTPLDVWNEGIRFNPPVAPNDVDDLEKLRSVPGERILHRVQGIDYLYERFHSQELAVLYDRIHSAKDNEQKKKVTILINPLDASAITVVDPKSGYLINVPNVDSRYVGKQSFAELNAHRKSKTAKGKSPIFESCPIRVKTRSKKNRSGTSVPIISDEELGFDQLLEPLHKVLPPPINIPTTSMTSAIEDIDDEDEDYEIE